MPATEMTYGVEIECGIGREVPVREGGYHNGLPVAALPAFNGKPWKAEHDGSLSFSDRKAVEFVSPVLKGKEGLDNIRAACAQIKAWNGATNQTCGLHIHVGLPAETPVSVIRNLFRIVGRFEDALFASTGTPHRRASNYCKPIKTDGNKRIEWRSLATKADLRHSRQCSQMVGATLNDRYSILNVMPFITERQNTVEFRVFSGSLNPAKIAAWIQICLSIVEMAIDGVNPDWDIDRTSVDQSKYGETWGERNVSYMCRYMWRWTCRKNKNYGELGHDRFTRKAAERTMLELARRHDERLVDRDS
jgi:hypothetical protein